VNYFDRIAEEQTDVSENDLVFGLFIACAVCSWRLVENFILIRTLNL